MSGSDAFLMVMFSFSISLFTNGSFTIFLVKFFMF